MHVTVEIINDVALVPPVANNQKHEAWQNFLLPDTQYTLKTAALGAYALAACKRLGDCAAGKRAFSSCVTHRRVLWPFLTAH
jgi:hypothetical protein